MRKLYLILICGILLAGLITAGITLTKDKEISKEDKAVLDKASVTGYQVSAIKCNTEKCDGVCITWNTKFSEMCFTPVPYNKVCKTQPPQPKDESNPTPEEQQAIQDWVCPEYNKVTKTKAQLESEVSNFEDLSIERILIREKINQEVTDKSGKSEISPSVDVTIKGGK